MIYNNFWGVYSDQTFSMHAYIGVLLKTCLQTMQYINGGGKGEKGNSKTICHMFYLSFEELSYSVIAKPLKKFVKQ